MEVGEGNMSLLTGQVGEEDSEACQVAVDLTQLLLVRIITVTNSYKFSP